MPVYLCDKPFWDIAIELAKLDEDAKIVLIKDGVYFDIEKVSNKKIYALKEDVEKRGLRDRLKRIGVEIIDYHQLVDLIVENKVMNFI